MSGNCHPSHHGGIGSIGTDSADDGVHDQIMDLVPTTGDSLNGSLTGDVAVEAPLGALIAARGPDGEPLRQARRTVWADGPAGLIGDPALQGPDLPRIRWADLPTEDDDPLTWRIAPGNEPPADSAFAALASAYRGVRAINTSITVPGGLELYLPYVHRQFRAVATGLGVDLVNSPETIALGDFSQLFVRYCSDDPTVRQAALPEVVKLPVAQRRSFVNVAGALSVLGELPSGWAISASPGASGLRFAAATVLLYGQQQQYQSPVASMRQGIGNPQLGREAMQRDFRNLAPVRPDVADLLFVALEQSLKRLARRLYAVASRPAMHDLLVQIREVWRNGLAGSTGALMVRLSPMESRLKVTAAPPGNRKGGGRRGRGPMVPSVVEKVPRPIRPGLPARAILSPSERTLFDVINKSVDHLGPSSMHLIDLHMGSSGSLEIGLQRTKLSWSVFLRTLTALSDVCSRRRAAVRAVALQKLKGAVAPSAGPNPVEQKISPELWEQVQEEYRGSEAFMASQTTMSRGFADFVGDTSAEDLSHSVVSVCTSQEAFYGRFFASFEPQVDIVN